MINLKRILEQFGTESQYYDLGTDFAGFKQSLDGSIDQLKHKFQTEIGKQLNGKRVIAKASRGYKQYVKDYEFDISKITIDDYYDNYVVVAHDMTTAKPKEYFLKPGYKIKIIGPATGQPSPQKGGNPALIAQHPSQPTQVSHTNPPVAPLKETDSNKEYDAYPSESIVEDLKTWLPSLLKKKETPLVDFIKRNGWTKNMDAGVIISAFELKIPEAELKFKLENQTLQNLFTKKAPNLKLIDLTQNDTKDEWTIKIKKIYRK